MVGRPSSSPSSLPTGSRGLTGFVRSLGREPARFGLRFLGLFALSSVAWSLLAPLYADLIASAAEFLAPVLEQSAGVTYEAQGSKIVALRPVPTDLARHLGGESAGANTGSPHGAPRVRQGLWEAGITFNVALLAAAVLATPGFTPRARARAVGVGVAGLAGSHLVHVLANIVYTQARFAQEAAVRLGHPPPTTGVGAHVAALVSFFFDSLGAGFFTILLYVLVLAWLWPDGRPSPTTRAQRRAQGRELGARAQV